jgi:dihydroxyacetone kinase-like protein
MLPVERVKNGTEFEKIIEVTMMITRDSILGWLKAYADAIATNKDLLTELDSAIGDADHGSNMHRGFQMVLTKLPWVTEQDIGSVLKLVGMTLISSVGGAGGPLYGTFFIQLGAVTAGKLELTPEDWSAALEAGVTGVILRGKATVGDKTMIDTLMPAVVAFKDALHDGRDLREALLASAEAAEQGMSGTIPLQARKGRASYLGERSIGHQDPGATSSHLLLKAAAATLWNGYE